MDLIPLGEVKPVPGTPDKLTVNFPQYDEVRINVLYLQVLPGNIGDIYLGRDNLNVATKTGIIARLRPPTLNHLPDLSLSEVIKISNPLNVGKYRIGVDNLNDGVIPSIGVA